MPKTVYYNGNFYNDGEAVIPLSDRSIFFGDAVYDAMIGRGEKIFLCEDHIKRLIRNAERLRIPVPHALSSLEDILYNVVKNSQLDEFFLYVQLSRCFDERIHAYPDSQYSSLLITASEYTLPSRKKRLKLLSTEDERYGFCDVKTVNLLPAVLASRLATEAACDEAVFHRGEVVTECAHSNISILKNGRLITHPDGKRILPGISKKHLLSACESLGVPYDERPFTLGELFDCDEALVTSTSKICLAASSLDGVPIGGKDQRLLKLLQNYMFEEYAFWTM